ncbi:MAG TPA: hypothetical protein VGK80_00540 [Rhodanobacteraceae bacterium]
MKAALRVPITELRAHEARYESSALEEAARLHPGYRSKWIKMDSGSRLRRVRNGDFDEFHSRETA